MFFDTELQRYGDKVTLSNPNDMHGIIKVSDPLVKETLEIWSEISFEKR